MRGRPKAELVLSDDEREQLAALPLRRTTAQALALRARIVLACAEGVDNRSVASRQRVTPQMVSKWRAQFVEHRLDGLLDAPRRGAPRTIKDTQVDAPVARTLQTIPEGATHWSTRLMASEMGLSQAGRLAHLASLRAAAAPARHLQAVQRSVVRGQAARHRRPVHGAAADGDGAVRR